MATTHVTAPLVLAHTDKGTVIYLYAGDVVPDEVSKESLAHLRDLGYVTDPKAAKKAETVPQPSGNASREEWADYAKAKGAGAEEVAEGGSTRDELRAKYGD